VFNIQGYATNGNLEEEGYACINFVVEKRDSSKTKVRNIKTIPMWMLGYVIRHLFSFTLMKMASG